MVFLSRVNLIMNPILAMLGATVHIRSIIDDMDGVAEPITPLGKQHDAWVRQRRLPYGLEPHDHPRDDPVPQGRIRRTMPLAGFTARAAGGRLVAGLREKTGDAGAVVRFHERTAQRYVELLGHSKGVLMKAGQVLSIVGASSIGSGGFSPYQAALARLQADAPPMDRALAEEIVHADLGRSVDEVFAEFTDEPMAAASIGQVHRAVLHDGRQVAVKIQYPGVAEAIRNDLANTELLATFVRFTASASGTLMHPDIRQMTREITASIAEEIDYRHEAANITAFSDALPRPPLHPDTGSHS